MMPGGHIDTYLKGLQRRLPHPVPRLLSETREHLIEAAAAGIARGLSPDEAEAEAVRSFGSVDSLVAAVRLEGGTLLSPLLITLISTLAVLLTLPTLIFVSANMIEIAAGTSGGESVFGDTFDAWKDQINALLIFGPMFALLALLLVSTRLYRDRGVRGFSATVEVRMNRRTFWVATVTFIVGLALLVYVVATNYPDWRDFHNQNWTCTTTHEGQQICYQGYGLPGLP